MTYPLAIGLSFLTAFALAFALTPAAIWIAPKIGAIDMPKDERRMHAKPMPRFGGLGIFIGITAALVFSAFFLLPALPAQFQDNRIAKPAGLLIGGALIYAVGVADDLWGISARVKFLLQIACACVVCFFNVRITFFTNPAGDGQTYISDILSFLITVVWIVGITNTINLIDGLDGLAAGVAAIASLSIAYTAFISESMYTTTVIMAAVAGGALGFLPFNFHPARIFMGDGGALFLGFMLASISIIGPVKRATVIATIVPALVLGLPILDTAFAILRRLAGGRSIMEADKGHLHHRLMAAGMGQKQSVLSLYGISGIMGVTAVVFSRDLFAEAVALLLIAGIFLYIFLSDTTGAYTKTRGVNARRAERHAPRNEEKQAQDLTAADLREAAEAEAEAESAPEAPAEQKAK
ncbi:MAG: undecaprenyl/decaprenyl-phosphate alpha-N-acetylglucosaminyl 1-phosphate transferase [Clostridiales Family XIII bacterium]|jgi:UDP-GlcNAc:undecaprenyl-phosphate GlcNAc-1-phosphate transferase|nr:undecaprenyl/decaprenyl-phosphate alpha-N-acetylglucosaminyl 1-phosphate transferase [Clostridiales Family XIII bacterium]